MLTRSNIMRTLSFLTIILTAACLCAVIPGFCQEAENPGMRTWTSTKGQTLEAQFVKLDYDMVYLKTSAGKIIQIKETMLCEKDRELIKTLVPKKAAEEPKTKPNLLLKKKTLSTSKSSSTTLTDDEIKKLITSWTDSKGTQYDLSIYCSPVSLSPKKDSSKMKKYARSGEVPFRIISYLYETKKGKKKTAIYDEKLYFYMLDEYGEIVFKTDSENFKNLCST
jgi:hypothetical protein